MPDPREDVLSTMTAVRVAAAAKVHSRFPQATLVMQGTGRLVVDGDKEIRHAARQGELMSQLAISLGVPSDKILMEVESRNSREHLDEILSFPGVNRKTPLGIVSADWHLRRLRLVFSEDFDQVWYFPASEPPVRVSGMARIWPTEGALSVSRLYLREWGAIIWYKLGGRSSGR
ncbi:MAG: YdcF family protein [Verrucomicrobia bacterium]|nr:YdcF family protein [Verrucomicrobiota bacterium]